MMNSKRKILIFDTETTGFDKDDQIIQIGSVMISGTRHYTEETFVKHEKEISVGSMTAHGIRSVPKNKAVSLKKTKTMKRINKLGKNDIVIGHNIDFDLDKVSGAIENDKFEIVDTLIIAEFMREVGMIPEDAKINLQYLRYLWVTQEREDKLIKKYKPSGGAHSALFDVIITNEIASIMINELAYYYLDKPDTVWDFVKHLYKNRFSPDRVRFNFGKYKGQTVRQVYLCDPSYLEWFYLNVDGAEREKKAIDSMVIEHNEKNK